jgi:hypothetical protein
MAVEDVCRQGGRTLTDAIIEVQPAEIAHLGARLNRARRHIAHLEAILSHRRRRMRRLYRRRAALIEQQGLEIRRLKGEGVSDGQRDPREEAAIALPYIEQMQRAEKSRDALSDALKRVVAAYDQFTDAATIGPLVAAVQYARNVLGLFGSDAWGSKPGRGGATSGDTASAS